MSIKLLKEAVQEGYTPLEYRACEIAEIYERIRRQFFPEQHYTSLNQKKDKRESKNFAYFYKLAESEQEKRNLIPDMALYIRGQFEMERLRFGAPENWVPLAPHCLVSKQAWERYSKYVKHLTVVEPAPKASDSRISARTVIKSLGKTATFLTKIHIDLFDEPEIDWPTFFFHTKEGDYMPLMFLFIMNKMVSRYFLATSKTYPSWRSSLDPDFRDELPTNLGVYAATVKVYPKAIEFGRQAFGSEFAL